MTKLVLDIQKIKEECQEDIDQADSMEVLNIGIEQSYEEVCYHLMYLLMTANMQEDSQKAMQLLDSVLNEVYYTGSNTYISKSFTIH